MKLKHCVPSKHQEPSIQQQFHIPDDLNLRILQFWGSCIQRLLKEYWIFFFFQVLATSAASIQCCMLPCNFMFYELSFSSDTVFLQAHTVITNNNTFVIKQSLLHCCLSFNEDSSCTCCMNSLLCTSPCLISALCSWSGRHNLQYWSY